LIKGIPSPVVCLCRIAGLLVGILASPPPAEPFPLDSQPWQPPPYNELPKGRAALGII